jgi:hypothetical protein
LSLATITSSSTRAQCRPARSSHDEDALVRPTGEEDRATCSAASSTRSSPGARRRRRREPAEQRKDCKHRGLISESVRRLPHLCLNAGLRFSTNARIPSF